MVKQILVITERLMIKECKLERKASRGRNLEEKDRWSVHHQSRMEGEVRCTMEKIF